MVFGQVVIGPPGSGKTTYCNGMSQFLSLIGRYKPPLSLFYFSLNFYMLLLCIFYKVFFAGL